MENAVQKYPDKVGFISENQRLTYKEFDGLVKRIAAGLSKHGVKKGDHVALLLGTQLDFPLSFFALQYHCSKEKDSLGIENYLANFESAEWISDAAIRLDRLNLLVFRTSLIEVLDL